MKQEISLWRKLASLFFMGVLMALIVGVVSDMVTKKHTEDTIPTAIETQQKMGIPYSKKGDAAYLELVREVKTAIRVAVELKDREAYIRIDSYSPEVSKRVEQVLVDKGYTLDTKQNSVGLFLVISW